MLATSSPGLDSPRIARRRIREQIRRRMPRPGADRRLAVTVRADRPTRADRLEQLDTAVGFDRLVDYTRLSGPRDDVLDYAAFLFATDTGWGETALELVAIEEDGETLTLLLGKPL